MISISRPRPNIGPAQWVFHAYSNLNLEIKSESMHAEGVTSLLKCRLREKSANGGCADRCRLPPTILSRRGTELFSQLLFVFPRRSKSLHRCLLEEMLMTILCGWSLLY